MAVTIMKARTYYREIHLEVLCGGILEVHPTSVNTLVVQLNRLQREGGRFRHGDEICSGPHRGAVRPVQGLVESPSPHVEAGFHAHTLSYNS